MPLSSSSSPARHRLPALFISHGAPTLALEKNSTTEALARIGKNLPKPRAAVVMSAHWHSPGLMVSTAKWPRQWHDYQLPKTRSWQALRQRMQAFDYRPRGCPALAEQLLAALADARIEAHSDSLRPFDHGVWAPLSHLYPDASVPVVQLSLPQSFDALDLYRVGAALAALRDDNVLLIGSGSTVHNLGLARHATRHDLKSVHDFSNWLIGALTSSPIDAIRWDEAPGAAQAHPTPEHLLPLFFAYGAGELVSVVHRSRAYVGLDMDILRFD